MVPPVPQGRLWGFWGTIIVPPHYMLIHLSLKSTNQKTGPIPVSTSPKRTCATACPFLGSGCYAASGPLAIHWSQVSSGSRGEPWRVFLGRIREFPSDQLWRHNQAGDLPGTGNRIDANKLDQLANANAGRRGFTYTHKPVISTPGVPADVVRANLRAVRSAVKAGFTINLSGNSLSHADRLAKTGLPVATVVPSGTTTPTLKTPAGNLVVICPAQRMDKTCASCGLCFKADRSFLIGFTPHGTGARKVNSIACATIR